MKVDLLLAQDGINPAYLGKPIVVRFEHIETGAIVERTFLNTAEGFIEQSLLHQKEVSRTPGIPPVIETTEVAYFFEGRMVRQDVNAVVDPVALHGAVSL